MAIRSRYLYLLRYILIFSDLILINLSFLIVLLVYRNGGPLFPESYLNHLLAWNLTGLMAASVSGMYRLNVAQHLVDIYRTTAKGIIIHISVFVFYLLFSNQDAIPRSFLLALFGLEFFFFLSSRFTGTLFEMMLMRHFKIGRPVAVLGHTDTETAKRVAGFFEKSQNFQFNGFLLHEEPSYVQPDGGLKMSVAKELADAAARGVKDVYVTLRTDSMSEALYLMEEAEKLCVRLKFIPDLHSTLDAPFTLSYMGGFPVISMREEPLNNIQNRFKKRLFDIAFSLLVLVFILSWLVPVFAVLIKLQSRGPVFFRQQRSGRNNEPFWCYKFRSMRVNKDSDKKQATKGDSRITPIGAFMRKTSLDELPQFFNVLIGNMSVVGPRPHMLQHTEQYSAIIDKYMVRQFLKPGITGWAQVNGFRGETEDPALMEARVEHDIWYMERWSVMLDVKITFMTVINVFKGEEKAY